jgi:hypothetical protein
LKSVAGVIEVALPSGRILAASAFSRASLSVTVIAEPKAHVAALSVQLESEEP